MKGMISVPEVSRNKKIRVLIPMRYPVGGIRTYLNYFYGNLDKESYALTFIGPQKKFLDRIKDDFTNHNVEIIYTSEDRTDLGLLRGICRALASRKYSVIHSQGYTAGAISSLANIMFRRPHIITLHHVFLDGGHWGNIWGKCAFAKRRVVELLLRGADIIVSVSQDAQENFLAQFPGVQRRATKLLVMRNGIDIRKFRNVTEIGEWNSEKEGGRFTIGFLGRYMPEKGFQYLIETSDILVKRLKVDDIKVVSVGGFGGFIREYQKEIASKGLMEYFEFRDFAANVTPILRKIRVLAIPSLGEAGPLVPMEGLVSGTPIVAFSCIGLKEILNNTPAIMVPVGDSEAMARELARIKEEYEDIKRQFEAFVPSAMERYDVRKSVKLLDNLLKGLAKGA
jgi:glycosyltransferase involved in cell wall biosynthesis